MDSAISPRVLQLLDIITFERDDLLFDNGTEQQWAKESLTQK